MELSYKDSKIRIVRDISHLEADAVVISSNSSLEIDPQLASYVQRLNLVMPKPIKPKAGQLVLIDKKQTKHPRVIYCLVAKKDFTTDELIIRNAYSQALSLAVKKGCNSLAFLEPGASKIKFPLKATAKIMAQEVLRHIRDERKALGGISFVVSGQKEFTAFGNIVFSYCKYIIHKLSQGPFSTVDILIKLNGGHIILIERSNPPFGWALPGGFVDYNESLEKAAVREAKEETSLDIFDLKQFHTYSQPGRDPRFHTIATVFTARAKGKPKASSDARRIGTFSIDQIRHMKLAFDHNKIIHDYLKMRPELMEVRRRRTT